MIRSITGATFALFAATSVQAMTPAPISRPDGIITQVAYGCGAGQTLVNGQCVARTYIRQARRYARRTGYGAGPYQYDAADISGPMAVNYAGIAGAAGTPVVAGPGYGGTGPYGGYYGGTGYYGGIETKPFYLQRAYYGNGPWYYVNGWAGYKARYGIVCDPGTVTKGDDGYMHVCQ